MEFRYRAVDGDRPSTAADTASSQPPNPSLPFFPTRPILGCNIGQSDDHVRETIQREIEKEQIRQEIIVVETLRRRAEVMQEMAVEREMAIRRVAETKGISLEDKLQNNNLCRQNRTYIDPMMYTSPYSLATSPMMQQLPQLQQMPETTGARATPVLESNKDKLIVLSRADPIGAKRKAEDTQNVLEREKRVAVGVGLDREPHLLDKEAALKAKPMTMETGETVSMNLPCLEELGSGKNVSHETTSTSFITAPASASALQTKAITVHQNANVQDQEVVAKETGKKTEGLGKSTRLSA
ncbi:hypothetical protein AALP_AA3G331000 [Arabis alpina]|uniref:Uncharacterized protein n=1 Tax=Arabis alpina TaxID=50452 RepID=A0A087HDA1_ARAAL|nr:hypothetical protein AALP_AA3G331000 [Arabis alpina]